MTKIISKAVAVFIILHGFAHLMATSVYWKLNESPDLPYTTMILSGRVDLGETGIWLFGLLWLVAGLATAVAGGGLLTGSAWARSVLLTATLFSLVTCVLVFEAAKIGIIINVLILAVIAILFRSMNRLSRPAAARRGI
jgi:hypothetical protein